MQFKAQFSFYISKMLKTPFPWSGMFSFVHSIDIVLTPPGCTPATARATRQSLGTSRRPPGSAGAPPSGWVERCTAADPTSPPRGSTAGARTAPAEHFRSARKMDFKTPPRQMWPSACCRPPHPYPCDDGGEQLQEGGQRLQLSLGDASERRVAVLRRVRVRQVSPQVLVVEHEGVKKVFP